ncbi:alkaline phosphatase D family protein [Stutzerimonas nitrititolerans]|uniref:alkaline phosphatase D family protein n=1 Tax=Stutzerimonas nitrititolerans TaxID=2482751 RepID=UPI0028A9472D|nr:alkaline phosphatase D family protein [Stutzerimonas nitrititolerans]
MLSLTDHSPVTETLPPVLAGPLLRRVEPARLVFWLVASRPLALALVLQGGAHAQPRVIPLDETNCQRLPIGRDALLHLVDVTLDEPLPSDCVIEYDLRISGEGLAEQGIADWAPHLLYARRSRPSFVIKSRLDRVLHGSCRKPHHPAADGLLCVDELLARELDNPTSRPAVLLMTGDQVYADDVAGPMLVAIHGLVRRLGLYGERLEGAVVADSEELFNHPATYYRREDLLPAFKSNEALRERFFGGVEKPVFTTANGHNHLITLGEVMAMYLLVWSPLPWSLIEPAMPPLDAKQAERYRSEENCLQGFRQGLPQAARALAHVPSLMIFDDHDITDDWNLSARWEETAYGHPLSRRIIGNALIAYLLCQAWGNQPERFGERLEQTQRLLETAAAGRLDCAAQDQLIDELFRLDGWGYELATDPPLVVLDTRTRRWRSERNLSRPSGLMDWEALSELQQNILDKPSVLIVSPPPMFGVKLIEVIQRIFSWAGQPLLVDAENWMAHRGAAHVMMNIFRHSRTPGNYVVLSGDVHYSFVYEVHIRSRDSGPQLWQITSSGVKNEFPRRLLDWFDRLNRWLYAPWSPLNWLTKRRQLEVVPRLPDRRNAGERLWNGSGIGLLVLDPSGRPLEIHQLNADGSPPTAFLAES